MLTSTDFTHCSGTSIVDFEKLMWAGLEMVNILSATSDAMLTIYA